jgi:prevent-host-death family protein
MRAEAAMAMSATELRGNLYRILDRVLETGEPVEIERNGRVIRLVPDVRVFHFDQLVPHPEYILGDPDSIIHCDWSDEWRP